MATNTYYEWHPHLGSIWSRMIDLWEGYIGDSTVSWASAITSRSSHTAIQITLTGATDTNIWVLVDSTRRAADFQPPLYIQSLPGWQRMPKLMPATQAGRTTKTDFGTNLRTLRGTIWVDYDNGDTVSYTTINKNLTSLNMTADWSVAVVRYDNQIVIDVLVIAVGDQTATEYFVNSRGPADMAIARPNNVLGGGGGAVDVSGIVNALKDMLHKVQQFSINGGKVIYQVDSSDIIEP